jgi:formate C-acetyltransferase
MSFINFARVMLAALEGGRDATSGKVFLPQESAVAGNFDNFDEVMATGIPDPLLHPQIHRD